jgi:NIMA-interacting peptidyl-prolyl cis-trans isomerase 1
MERGYSLFIQATITRTEEEALEILKGFREKIASGEVEFAALAAKESDCSSAKRGGDLGPFSKGQMQGILNSY